MIGKQIHELLDMTEADISDNITLLRSCGLAPNVVSLLEKRKLWANRLHSLPLDAMTHMDEKKVSLCTFLYFASTCVNFFFNLNPEVLCIYAAFLHGKC